MGASGGVMVRNLDLQTFVNEFESHCVPHSYGYVLHLRKRNLINYFGSPSR